MGAKYVKLVIGVLCASVLLAVCAPATRGPLGSRRVRQRTLACVESGTARRAESCADARAERGRAATLRSRKQDTMFAEAALKVVAYAVKV